MALLAATSLGGCKACARGPSCAEQVAELRRFVAAVDAEAASETPLPAGTKLVRPTAPDDVPSGRLAHDGPVLTLVGREVSIDGSPLSAAEAGALVEKLSGAMSARRELDSVLYPGRPPRRVVPRLALPPDAPWSAVVALTTASQKVGFDELVFVFEARSTVPRRSAGSHEGSRDPSLAAPVSQSGRAVTVATDAEKLFTRCAAATSERVSLVDLDPSSKGEEWSNRLPTAIERCDCQVDLEAFRTLHVSLRGPVGGTPQRAVGVSLRACGDGVKLISRSPSEPWSAAHGAVLEASRAGGSFCFR